MLDLDIKDPIEKNKAEHNILEKQIKALQRKIGELEYKMANPGGNNENTPAEIPR